jgi:hypothetical protein
MDIRLQTGDGGHRCKFFKNDHIIDALEGSQDLDSLGGRDERSSGPLELAHGGIAVHAYYQDVPSTAGGLQVAHVPDME